MKKKVRRTLDRKLALEIPDDALVSVSSGHDPNTGTFYRCGVDNALDGCDQDYDY